MLETFYKAGGLFAVLTFIHFFSDWIFQSHAEAMVKHNQPWIRAKHCLIYTLFFIPILLLVKISILGILMAAAILFISHFFEDTYYPVYLWAKYIRKVPGMGAYSEKPKPSDESYFLALSKWERAAKESDTKAFVEFISTPLGKILMIVIDQIIHLTFLWAVVWIMMKF